MKERDKLLFEIKEMFQRDRDRRIFKKFIEYIRFPFFKNFEKNMKVNFTFPITFIVGQNGSGKSSLLQALYGSPKDLSLENYWFTTALDPIKDLKDNRHCLIYSYKTEYSKQNVEVLKTRVSRKDNPDYWEPSKPVIKYGMKRPNDYDKYNEREVSKSKDRWNLLEKKLYYLDFRYIISAYDKYFYLAPLRKTKNLKKKQDFIRKYSYKLKQAFESESEIKYYERQIKKPIKLSKNEVQIINDILGKKYTEILIAEHNLYEKNEGFTILFKTENYNKYSEAYAGSGESSVVNLINTIFEAENYSLILLDEPETSLHPTAQKKLIDFILQQIKIKKLQVVISTHSPDIIEDMPKEAIKILYENLSSGKIGVMQNIYPENAFAFIGRTVSNKKVIIVEDVLAKTIIEAVIKEIDEEKFFDVKFFPGGESRIKQEFMLVYSKDNDRNHFVFFDGDQRRKKIKIENLKESDKTIDNLEKIIKDIVGEHINFAVDAGKNISRKDQKIELMLNYIKYHHDNVFYLPKNIPEEIIWDESVLNRADLEESEKEKIKSEIDYKKKFNLFAKYNFGGDSHDYQQKAYEYFLVRWLKNKNEDYKKITEMIEFIKEGDNK